MPLELAAVAYNGAFTAERELNNLRVSRLDPWVGEIAVLEHHDSGMFFTRATSPDYGGKGHSQGPGPLLSAALIGTILAGAGAFGSAQTTGALGSLADQVRSLLPADASALMLVAESAAIAEFVSALSPTSGKVGRRELPDGLIEQLRLAASS